ncbi:hypothetical protein M9458_025336, partial [Cirrhinus mrigala]
VGAELCRKVDLQDQGRAPLMYTISWKWYSLVAVASFNRIMPNPTKQKFQEWFEEHYNEFK